MSGLILRLRLLWVSCLAVLLLAPASAWAADQTTVTIQLRGDVPVVDRSVLGVVTINLSCTSGTDFVGDWYFDGTLDGQAASASGQAEGRWHGGRLSVTITSIDTWQMPGLGRFAVPSTASARTVGKVAYLTFRGKGPFPAAINTPLKNPCAGGTTQYVLTNAGTGVHRVPELPQTGAGPSSAWPVGWVLVGLCLAGAAGALGARLALSRR